MEDNKRTREEADIATFSDEEKLKMPRSKRLRKRKRLNYSNLDAYDDSDDDFVPFSFRHKEVVESESDTDGEISLESESEEVIDMSNNLIVEENMIDTDTEEVDDLTDVDDEEYKVEEEDEYQKILLETLLLARAYYIIKKVGGQNISFPLANIVLDVSDPEEANFVNNRRQQALKYEKQSYQMRQDRLGDDTVEYIRVLPDQTEMGAIYNIVNDYETLAEASPEMDEETLFSTVESKYTTPQNPVNMNNMDFMGNINILIELMTQYFTKEEHGDEYWIKKFNNEIDSLSKISDMEKNVYKEYSARLTKELFADKEGIIKKILDIDISDDVKKTIIQEYITSEEGNHTEKLKSWLFKLMRIPFNKYTGVDLSLENNEPEEVHNFLQNLKHHLDASTYGQNIIKEYMIEMSVNSIVNAESKGQCVGLCGPPGVGKTSIILEGLSKALDRPCISISLAGAEDVSVLTGHSFTYEGSRPGRIVEGLMQVKCMNPIIFFDEVDKIDPNSKGLSVIYKLIELIDFTQNYKIEDEYFSGIPIDLSKCTFIFSMNNSKNLHPILLNRIHIINVEGFSRSDKINIIRDYLVPKEEKANKFKEGEVVFTKEAMNTMIYSYTNQNDKGVRKIKEIVNSIYRKLSVLRFTSLVSYSKKTNLYNEEGKIVVDTKLLATLLKDMKKVEYLSYYN